jgi:predicted  nucleic acid-binding Zn ribbon protein
MKIKKFAEKELTIIEYEDLIQIGDAFKGQKIKKKTKNEIKKVLEELNKQGYKLKKESKNKFGDKYYYLEK